MINLPLVLVLGLLSAGADMPADIDLTAPTLMAMTVQATPLEAATQDTDLFQPIQNGVPIFVPTTNLSVCEEDNSCPPGCLCLEIRNVENCYC